MLEKLRAKPDHIKQSIAIVLTIIIFCGILFVWVSSWDARSRDQEVRDKTVSPLSGVTSMFDGLISGLKGKIVNTRFSPEINNVGAVSTSTDNFDISGVVIIDSTASSTENSVSATKKN